MKPKKAVILLVLALVTVALLGLIGVQLFFLNQSYKAMIFTLPPH